MIDLDLCILGNFGKSILHRSTRLEDSIEKLKETVQAYTNAIVDLEGKLVMDIFKQSENLNNTLESLFNEFKSQLHWIEAELRALVGMALSPYASSHSDK